MDFLLGIFIAVGWIVGFVLSRIITTFFHEMGHAIPALMYTEGPVKIHLGSYGKEKNSAKFIWGRLQTILNFNVFNWNIGMCSYDGTKNRKHIFWIVLGGPLFSLIFGGFLLFLILTNNFSDGVITILTVFILAAVFDFFVNMIPSIGSMQNDNGEPILSDGTILFSLFYSRNFSEEFLKAEDLFGEKKYDEAILLYQKIINDDDDKTPYRMSLIQALVDAERFDEAAEQIEILKERNQFGRGDLHWLGEISMKSQKYYEAISYFNDYLYKNYEDVEVLYKRGYCYIQIAEYGKAIQNFDSALIYQPKFNKALTFRGLAKIRSGYLEEGKSDVEQSMKIDDKDPYIYLTLGYYYQQNRNRDAALENFKKAKEMNIDFHGIDYLIETV